MPILAAELENFRNFTSLSCAFSPSVNVITGENAQGKTNLIEAIFYLSAMKSFRTAKDDPMIRHDAGSAFLRESFHNGQRDFVMEVTLRRNERKRVLKNDIPVKRSAEVVGLLPVVLFTPDDLDLIKAGGSERRRLLDLPLCQMKPLYLETLARYNRTLRMKRALLKRGRTPENEMLLDAYNADLARHGSQILLERAAYLDKLEKEASPLLSSLSGEKEELSLLYRTVSVADPQKSAKENETLLYERLSSLMESEFETEACLSGIHKDDVQIDLNSFSARTYASQGQMRSIALSLKLAERELLKKGTSSLPVLLLDDVLSELDPKRQRFILNHVEGGQVFITCCDEAPLSAVREGKVFELREGKIVREEERSRIST
ncbi:MAG: DNA replication/repair protein RecF [Clostridia bacterium]|nr:DNA replication/repair protein RecF [Clostridia bacterium]